MPRTRLPADLLLAYRLADYEVVMSPLGQTPRRLGLRVTRRAPELDAWLRAHAPASAMLLTACNPRSRPLGYAANRMRNGALRRSLRAHGLDGWSTTASDPTGIWPDEPGLLVAGIDRGSAARWGRRYKQNAVLWLEAGMPVELLLLR